MKYKVILYSDIYNPEEIYPLWPAEVEMVDDSVLSVPAPYLLFNPEEYNNYLVTNQAGKDAWDIQHLSQYEEVSNIYTVISDTSSFGNLDGGTAYSVYGGTDTVNGGDASSFINNRR